MSQYERFPPSLDPAYFKIDERSTADFLQATIQLAAQVNYYGFGNTVEGNWENFFDSDIDLLLQLMAGTDLQQSIRRFEALTALLREAEDEAELAGILQQLFVFLHGFALPLIRFSRKLQLAANRNSHTLHMEHMVETCYQDAEMLLHYIRQAGERLNGFSMPALLPLTAQPVRLSSDNAPVPNLLGSEQDTPRQAMHALPLLNDLFAALRLKYTRLVTAAKHYAAQRGHRGSVYDPHLALFMTFLQLFGHLQQQLNQFTGRHLDYYYRERLGIALKKQVPDKVYVVLELAATAEQPFLAAGELLVSELPGSKKTVLFQLDQQAFLGQANILELKTGFISAQVQFTGGHRQYQPVEELRVYTGDYPVTQPATYLQQKNRIKPWPLMGEDQGELPLQNRTMEDAAIGLLIASPLLYLRDGKRQVQLRLYLEAASALYLQQYVNNFSGATGYNAFTLLHDLLRSAFLLSITGDAGWISGISYKVGCALDKGIDSYIELHFILYPGNPPVGMYSNAIHGGAYGVNTPAIRLEINNASFHNAFVFLRRLQVSRVGIEANVTGSRELRMQNNFGPLSARAPFQPFGPVPATGSYLDLKNTNVFNRFTKKFSVSLEWFDLPREEGGFQTYFSAYGNQVTNESFQVSVGAVINGRHLPEAGTPQTFSLFHLKRHENGRLLLKHQTLLENITAGQVNFFNNPRLQTEYTAASDLFNEGVVRIELTGPADAFGHKLYQQLFPAVMMHNARRFVAPRPVPNPPYTPMVKSVVVDYTLSHIEVLANRLREPDNTSVTLVHLHPFGHRTVYPNSQAADITLVPYLDQSSNLFIGLQNVTPAQVISLFFQLEEKTFHHTVHDQETVQWSYLHQNEWRPLPEASVLADCTDNFINSGIVSLQLPAELAPGNTLLNPNCCWIRASIEGNKTAQSRVLAVFTQAASALRVTAGDEEDAGNNVLPAGCIKGFQRKQPEIKKVWQFFPSFNGRAAETPVQYYVRVSERLRHKQRPLTAIDIAQVILEAFPEILMVKCFGADVVNNLILPMVNLQVIVMPKEKEDGHFISTEPRVNLVTLSRIKQFIGKQLSGFARAEVGNPVYEKVKVSCSVVLRKDALHTNDGYFLKLLDEDIRRFIAPWLFSGGQEVNIGSSIYVQDMLDYLQKRPYIAYVTGFSVMHFYREKNMTNGISQTKVVDSAVNPVYYLQPSRPFAILVPADTHFLRVLKDPVYVSARHSGIGDLVLGNELVIYQEKSAAGLQQASDDGEEEYMDFSFQT